MEQVLCKDKIYTKPWGKHKNGLQMIIYNSGSYGIYKRLKDGIIDTERSVLLKCKDGSYDDVKYALENGYVLSV